MLKTKPESSARAVSTLNLSAIHLSPLGACSGCPGTVSATEPPEAFPARSPWFWHFEFTSTSCFSAWQCCGSQLAGDCGGADQKQDPEVLQGQQDAVQVLVGMGLLFCGWQHEQLDSSRCCLAEGNPVTGRVSAVLS